MPLALSDSVSASGDRPLRLQVVTPVFNDTASLRQLLVHLDRVAAREKWDLSVLAVDDGSVEPVARGIADLTLHFLKDVSVLPLRRNLGHQRAIAIGLSHVASSSDSDAVLVMDADGEDRPEDLPALVRAFEAHGRRRIVFARRRRRSESLLFRAGYASYRWAHLLLTGVSVRFGNFSIVPAEQLDRLTMMSELWNHYAATVVVSRLPYVSCPLNRGTRYDGSSHLGYTGLIVHGLSALSVFAPTIGARLLMTVGAASATFLAAGSGVAGLRLFTGAAIPGWATVVIGLLAVLMLQSWTLAAWSALVMLQGRAHAGFIPRRDFQQFAAELVTVQRIRPGQLQRSA